MFRKIRVITDFQNEKIMYLKLNIKKLNTLMGQMSFSLKILFSMYLNIDVLPLISI